MDEDALLTEDEMMTLLGWSTATGATAALQVGGQIAVKVLSGDRQHLGITGRRIWIVPVLVDRRQGRNGCGVMRECAD